VSIGPSDPARRAVVRWAWRLFRREWRQQLVVLTLITVAVAASVAATAVTVNAVSRADGRVGTATALVHIDATDPAAAARGIDAARQRFGVVEVISHRDVTLPGLPDPLDMRAQDPDGTFGHSTLALVDGRYPTAPDEVALTDGAASALSVAIGEHVELAGVSRTVVGRVENPDDLDDEFALLAPGADPRAPSLTLLAHGDGVAGRATVDGQSSALPLEIEVFGNVRSALAAVLLVAVTLAMALVGLVATSGFVVIAQRRQRQLGLLAAIGATQRHLRLVMLADGALVGATAAIAGGILGIVGWIVVAPAVEAAAAHRIDRFDLPWGLIVACLVIAVVMATAAAWWPARTMARAPVITALSGRPARPIPVHRSLLAALALLVVGVIGIAAAQPVGDHVRPPLLVAGIVAVVLGVVLAAPAAIRAIAAPAAHLPFATRLALRDLVRYQARAAAALAAITLGVGIAVSIVALAQANVAHGDQGNLSDRQLVVSLAPIHAAPPTGAQNGRQDPAELARLDAQAAAVAVVLGPSTVFPLDVAIDPSTTGDAQPRQPIMAATPTDHGFEERGIAYVATPALLHRYGIDRPADDDATELLTSMPGDVILLDIADPAARGEKPSTIGVRRAPLPQFTSGPRTLITAGAMQRHGWIPLRTSWLVETPTALTPDQITRARDAAAANGLTIEVRRTQDDVAAVRNIATIVGALTALSIVAMTIGLIRSESSRDLRTLTATGASPRTRRAITASTAGALALLGVVLGVAGAYVALIAAYHADLAQLVPPPILNLIELVVGLPLAAAAAGWLLAGRDPTRYARQALD
jgi:putative ABC transport system permease protein